MTSIVGVGLSFGLSSKALQTSTTGSRIATHSNHPTRRMVAVRAEAGSINPEIRKTEDKVADSIVVAELAKTLTAYCRCWRSGTFPFCDGSHVSTTKLLKIMLAPCY